MAGPKEQVTVSVHEVLLELRHIGFNSDEIKTLKEITDYRPVKIDLEILLPPGKEDEFGPQTALKAGDVETKAKTMQTKAAFRDVAARYTDLVTPQLGDALRLTLEKYRFDQQGQTGGFAAADAALKKANKFVETKFEYFRVDLREAIGKRLGISPKAIMTVGRVATKEIEIATGAFNSEVEPADDKVKGNELGAAFKKKKWQHCGAAFDSAEGKVLVDPKKKFKKADLKALDELFTEDERNGLKYAKGQVQAESETNLHFEFMKKDGNKLPGNAEQIRKRLMRGLKNQTGKNYSSISVKVVDKYSGDIGSSTKSEDSDGKPTPSPTPTPTPKPTKKKGT